MEGPPPAGQRPADDLFPELPDLGGRTQPLPITLTARCQAGSPVYVWPSTTLTTRLLMFRFCTCRLNLLSAAVLLTLASILRASAQTSTAETAASAPRGVDVAAMDRSVKPGDAFYEYANGTWLKQTEIPADRSTYGAGAMLTEIVDRRVAELIQQTATANTAAGS